jgi:hypothetical protein
VADEQPAYDGCRKKTAISGVHECIRVDRYCDFGRHSHFSVLSDSWFLDLSSRIQNPGFDSSPVYVSKSREFQSWNPKHLSTKYHNDTVHFKLHDFGRSCFPSLLNSNPGFRFQISGIDNSRIQDLFTLLRKQITCIPFQDQKHLPRKNHNDTIRLKLHEFGQNVFRHLRSQIPGF